MTSVYKCDLPFEAQNEYFMFFKVLIFDIGCLFHKAPPLFNGCGLNRRYRHPYLLNHTRQLVGNIRDTGRVDNCTVGAREGPKVRKSIPHSNTMPSL
jgi:hypothetical protein